MGVLSYLDQRGKSHIANIEIYKNITLYKVFVQFQSVIFKIVGGYAVYFSPIIKHFVRLTQLMKLIQEIYFIMRTQVSINFLVGVESQARLLI